MAKMPQVFRNAVEIVDEGRKLEWVSEPEDTVRKNNCMGHRVTSLYQLAR
jgi:hypothetical protein